MALKKISAWAQGDNPVYRLEAAKTVTNKRLRSMQLGCLPSIIGVMGLGITAVLGISALQFPYWNPERYVIDVLLYSLLAMLFLQVTTGAALNISTIAFISPAVSGELEMQSWSILRTTALNLVDVLLGKCLAVMVHLRLPLIGIVLLRAVSLTTALLLITFAFWRDTLYYWDTFEWQLVFGQQVWIPVLVAGTLIALFYLLQPMLQFLISDALGVLASTITRSRTRAIATGMALRLSTWIVAILLNVGIMIAFVTLFTSWADPRFSQIEVFRNTTGPSQAQQWWVMGISLSSYVLAVLLGQVGLLAFCFGMAVRRARRLVE